MTTTIWLPELDPANDAMLAELGAFCASVPEIPPSIFAFAVENAIQNNTARAKRELFAWADSVGIVRPTMQSRRRGGMQSRKTYAPVLWTMYEDGWRCTGMSASQPSVSLRDLVTVAYADEEWLAVHPAATRIAHYDETVLLDFDHGLWGFDSLAESWTVFAAFPRESEANAFVFGDMLRRAKHEGEA